MATHLQTKCSPSPEPADVYARWKKVKLADRRVLRRLAQFSGAFPVDALMALGLEKCGGTLERLLALRVLTLAEPQASQGFRLVALFAELARGMPATPKERESDLDAFGHWILEHVSEVLHSAADTSAAFERLETLVPDVQRVVGELAESRPELAAKLWCAIADLLFYRRLLPFDCPEYTLAIHSADRSQNHELRAHTRVVAARALLEVRSPDQARGFFEEARDIATARGLDLWRGDAVRGLGWVVLAEGNAESAKEHFVEAHKLHEAKDCARGVADACMALGVVNMLLANREEADKLLFRAEAILRARHDSVRLEKLETLRQTLGLSVGRVGSEEVDLQSLLARGQYWRGALLRMRSEDPSAKRHAEVLADLAGVSWKELTVLAQAPSRIPKHEALPGWQLHCEGLRRVLEGPDGTRHDLTRRGPLTKLLEALACAKGSLSAMDLFDAAWPNEKVRHEAALFRVYTTVRRLRALGVPIATSGDGYFCEQIQSVG